MAREYTPDWYLERIAGSRPPGAPSRSRPTSLWVFLGETADDFIQTMDLLAEVEYDCVFGFKYSARPNTPALVMIDSIPRRKSATDFKRCLIVSVRFKGSIILSI
jgi:tRNA-2-methylthio-N6-dimethylallyladenosine synthase